MTVWGGLPGLLATVNKIKDNVLSYLVLFCMCYWLLWWLSDKESACQYRRGRFDPWSEKIPWRRKWQPTPVFLPGDPLDRGAWMAAVHVVVKSQT